LSQSHIKLTGGAGTGKSLRATITQAGHGFKAGQAIRFNRSTATGSGTDKYYAAIANNAENSEVVGVIASAGANTFVLVYTGEIDSSAFDPNFAITDNDVFFLSETTDGKLTSTPPSEAGSVIKPVLVRTNDDVCIVTNYIGTIIGGSSTVSLNGIQPVGTIEPYAGTLEDVPETWSACNGDPLSTTIYPSLYNRLGKRYGYHIKITDGGISGDIAVGNRIRQGSSVSGIITSVTTGSMEVDVDYLAANTDGSYTQHTDEFFVGLGQSLIIDNEVASNRVGSIKTYVPRADTQDVVTLTNYSISTINFRKPDLRGKFVIGAADSVNATAISVPAPGFALGQLGGDYDNETGGGAGAVQGLGGSDSLNNVPPYQSLNWIIKTESNAPAALIDNITAQISIPDLIDVVAPPDQAQSGDILMFDSTNVGGAKYYPYRIFDGYPATNAIFNIGNISGDASIRFGSSSSTRAFDIDLDVIQPNATNRQFSVKSGSTEIIRAKRSTSTSQGAVGIGINPSNDTDANLVIGSKGLKFNNTGQLITQVKNNVSTTGSDNALVTEQGIREAIDSVEIGPTAYTSNMDGSGTQIGQNNYRAFTNYDASTTPGQAFSNNYVYKANSTGISSTQTGVSSFAGRKILLFLGLRVYNYKNEMSKVIVRGRASTGTVPSSLGENDIKFITLDRADGDGRAANSIMVPIYYEVPASGNPWLSVEWKGYNQGGIDTSRSPRICSYQVLDLGAI